jgi:hypothetical protein
MGLLDDLREAVPSLDAQFQPSSNEVGPLLGALVHYQEHGQAFLVAAADGTDAVTELLDPPPKAEQHDTAGQQQQGGDEASDDELERRIADMQAQLASRQATSQQTTVTHEPGAAPYQPPPMTTGGREG